MSPLLLAGVAPYRAGGVVLWSQADLRCSRLWAV